MPFAAVGGIDVYHEVHGPGDDAGPGLPVLNITGTGNDLRISKPATHPLNGHFTTVHFDQRGLGQTSKPIRDWTMEDHAADAVGLLDVLGIDCAHVVGTSFGGMVAQHVAIHHPDRVASLVMCCTSSGGDGGSSADLRAVAALPPDEQATARIRLMDTRWRSLDDVPERMQPWFSSRVAHHAKMDRETAEGARRQLLARADHNTYDRLPGVEHRTLVTGGLYDGQAPRENAQAIVAQMPNARLQLFDGGHLFLIQDPTAWPAIIEFLNTHDAELR